MPGAEQSSERTQPRRLLAPCKSEGGKLIVQVFCGSHRFRLNDVQTDFFDSGMEIEHSGSAVAQVHDPALNERSTVVDADDYRFPISQVGDPDIGPQGKLAVRSGHFEHVEVFTAGGGSAVKAFTVPGSIAYLIRSGIAF